MKLLIPALLLCFIIVSAGCKKKESPAPTTPTPKGPPPAMPR